MIEKIFEQFSAQLSVISGHEIGKFAIAAAPGLVVAAMTYALDKMQTNAIFSCPLLAKTGRRELGKYYKRTKPVKRSTLQKA